LLIFIKNKINKFLQFKGLIIFIIKKKVFCFKKNIFFNYIGNLLNIHLNKIFCVSKLESKKKFNIYYVPVKLKSLKKKLKIFIGYIRKKKVDINLFNIKYLFLFFLIKCH
jgi:hypothetical protein